MKRNGNFYYHFRTERGKLVHRGKTQSYAPKIKYLKIIGVETTANLTNVVVDFKITHEGLREMRRRSLIVIDDNRHIWTPARIIKLAHRVQVMNISGQVETAENSCCRNRQGNIKF